MPFIHSLSDVKSKLIGKYTKIWQYAVIFPKAVIGEYCNICAHTLVENDVIIGNNVTIKSGVYLWDGIVIEDDVFIGPNATFTNDKFPRSRDRRNVQDETFQAFPMLKTTVKKGASIGANATILPGVVIGRHSMIGAGSVVINDVPDFAVVVGNPAKIIGNTKA